MAADDAADKTEAPTPRRREEAREEGHIARSADLTAAVGLIAGLLLLQGFGGHLLQGLFGMTRSLGDAHHVHPDSLWPAIQRLGLAAAAITFPLLVAILVITAVGTVLQSGWLLTWKKVGFKPDRLNPVAGFQRIFSGESLARLAIGLLKMLLVAWTAYATIAGGMRQVLASGSLEVGSILSVTLSTTAALALRLGLILLLLGILDYAQQRWRLERNLRMSRQEVRDELKRMEGDPLVRQRRRELQRRLALQGLRRDVPKADVVVTNPTEYAVALQYDAATMAAPKLLAKGRDQIALRIRQIALQFSIPIVQRPPLARALYATVEVGHEVPPEFYQALAEVLAYVHRLTGRRTG